MKGVLDLVNEFQTFKGGSFASGCEGGCRHGGCWREDMVLEETSNGNRCLGQRETRGERGGKTGIKKKGKEGNEAIEREGLN